MGRSVCCDSELIQWFGKVKFSLQEQDLDYTLLCMKCGKPAKEKSGVIEE